VKKADNNQEFREKLYSPLIFYLRDNDNLESYDEVHYWRDEISHEDAFEYRDKIALFLANDRKHYDTEQGLAEYISSDRCPSLSGKVKSIFPQFELHGSQLYMVADITLNSPLNKEETAELKDYWIAQLSDGAFEGWEHREIKVGAGELYIEPWHSGSDFFVDNSREFSKRLGLEREYNRDQNIEPDLTIQ
jgi:hypothetical protein